MRIVYPLLVVLLLLGCTPSFPGIVPRVPGEIMYEDVFSARLPADKIVVFGIRLGDPEARIQELHGAPTDWRTFAFGRVVNYEYVLPGGNATDVLYHLEEGIVTGILVTSDANRYLQGETVLRGDRARVYQVLGQPSMIQDLPTERRLVYDYLGYEVYLRRNQVDRVYFAMPGTLDSGPGTILECPGGPVNASDGVSCVALPNVCVLPDGWQVVESCANAAPVICVQGNTPAVDPVTGACTDFPSSCDVPPGYLRVAACPDTSGFCAQVVTAAMDSETGVCVSFPTPCHVPDGWVLGCS